jgi:hypothetical protein
MTPWHRFFTHVLQAWARCMLELTDLVFDLGDLPDGRPAMPDFIDHEYFDLLDRARKDRP